MRRNKLSKMMALVLLLLAPISLLAQKLTLGDPFGEGAVLQQNSVINIWGTSAPYKEVTGEIQGKQFKAKSDKSGRWEATLSGLAAGGPYQLKVNSGATQLIRNEIYVGEVWIAAGQSNMAWTLEQTYQGKEHIKNAKNPDIRFVMVPYKEYDGKETQEMVWKTATTENVGPMSGIAYFFAKDLQEKLNVPIGIICCYKGGTAAEVWMDRKVILSNPDHAPIVTYYDEYVKKMGLEKYVELYNAYTSKLRLYQDSIRVGYRNAVRPDEPMGEFHYKRPYGLYNTMLKRIIPYTTKGVIWYQGEANAPRSEQYQTLFPALINEWRTEFKNPDMPFLFVQLANYDHPKYNGPVWPELREAQLKTWQTVKNTAMVVTMDVGEKDDIHPVYKEPVGQRMAACALNTVYHFNIPYSGPIYKSKEIRGNQIILSFDYVYSGLESDGELKGFTICTTDKQFVPAQAKIEGDKVVVGAEGVTNPVAIRYGWDNWSEGNLKNKEGFPASPFRTDDFPLLTKGVQHTNY